MKIHNLKVWPVFFVDLSEGFKTFEIRKDDRGYEVGDRLVLKEWDPASEQYTGRETWRSVAYVMRGGKFGLELGFVAMAIR